LATAGDQPGLSSGFVAFNKDSVATMRKQFAIATLMFLPIVSLGYPSKAGNLGVADQVMIGVDSKNPNYSKKSFKVHPGPRTGMGTDTALAEFKDGLFTIKTDPATIQNLKDKGRIDPNTQVDESGIRPEQVISFSYHIQSPNIVYTLLYRDTQGKPQLATWGFLWSEDDVKSFKHVFLEWYSASMQKK
jgi:hypothetical protein